MKDKDSVEKEDIPLEAVYGIDGGALLHRVRWIIGMTFKDLAKLYVKYTRQHYRSATTLFDGHNTILTNCDEHARRARARCQDVEIHESNTCPSSQEKILSKVNNKIKFICFISQLVADDAQNVINCDSDADTKIVQASINTSMKSTKTAVVVADNTDIAIMLLYHWKDQMCDFLFYTAQLQKAWSLSAVSQKINYCKDHLLFVHAWSGCDTVSAPFGKGKVGFLKLVEKNEELKEISQIMNNILADKTLMGALSIRIFEIMYFGKKNDSLTTLR